VKVTEMASLKVGFMMKSPLANSIKLASLVGASWLGEPWFCLGKLAFSSLEAEVVRSLLLRSVIVPGTSTKRASVIPRASILCWIVRYLSDHLPVGVSGQSMSIPMAVTVIRMNGTIKATLHAAWFDKCWRATRESKMAGMTK